MKYLCYIVFFFSSINYYAQNNLTVAFDFDSTKVYVKYPDLVSVLKPDNKKFGDLSRLLFKNDTLFLNTYWLDDAQHLDSLGFDLDKELFTLINQKKASIYYHQQLILSYYTRKVTYRSNMRVIFIGLDYIDKASKQAFLIQSLYSRHRCNFGVRF